MLSNLLIELLSSITIAAGTYFFILPKIRSNWPIFAKFLTFTVAILVFLGLYTFQHATGEKVEDILTSKIGGFSCYMFESLCPTDNTTVSNKHHIEQASNVQSDSLANPDRRPVVKKSSSVLKMTKSEQKKILLSNFHRYDLVGSPSFEKQESISFGAQIIKEKYPNVDETSLIITPYPIYSPLYVSDKKSPSMYLGEFKNNKKHGIGLENTRILSSLNTSTYIGHWQNGKKHGEGTYACPDTIECRFGKNLRDTRRGGFFDRFDRNNRFNLSKCHDSNQLTRKKVILRGNWKEDILQGGTCTYPNGKIVPAKIPTNYESPYTPCPIQC